MSSGAFFLLTLTLILLISNFYKSFAAIEFYAIHCSAGHTNEKEKIWSFNGDDSECNFQYDSKIFQFNDRRQLKCEGNGTGKCKWSKSKSCQKQSTVKKENSLVIYAIDELSKLEIQDSIKSHITFDYKVSNCCNNNKISNLECKQTYQYCWDKLDFNRGQNCFNMAYNEGFYKTGDATKSKLKNYIGIYDQFKSYIFEEANDYCKDRFNTELASIHNKVEEEEIKDLFWGYNDIYIGLNDISREGRWKWKDATDDDYIDNLDWAKGEPNNNGRHGEDCGVIGKYGEIYDSDCRIKRNRFICNAPSSRRRIKESNNLIERLS